MIKKTWQKIHLWWQTKILKRRVSCVWRAYPRTVVLHPSFGDLFIWLRPGEQIDIADGMTLIPNCTVEAVGNSLGWYRGEMP